MDRSASDALEVAESSSSVADYISLLKPRVMSLAVFTSVCGLLLSPQSLHPFLSLVSIFCISLGAGASGAINMWFDRDIDVLMGRTRGRPIPAGKITPGDALGFGIILSLVSVVLLGLAVNYFAAFLLGISIAFYICRALNDLLHFGIIGRGRRYGNSKPSGFPRVHRRGV